MRNELVRRWHGLGHEHRVLAVQAIRYGVVGVGITIFQIAIYNLLSGPVHSAPLVAVTLATIAAMAVGYVIHSRFTFEGHGSRGSVARTGGRFVAAAMVGFAANALWVWLFTTAFHWPRWTPSLPMFFVTPFLLFWLNRKWVFD